MAEIRLDIYNPAQFYAVLGMLTVFSQQHPDTVILSHFQIEHHTGENNAEFVMESEADLILANIIADLRTAKITDEKSVPVSRNEKIKNPTYLLPVNLQGNGWSLLLDWWLDEFQYDVRKNPRLKMYAGDSSPLNMLKQYQSLIKDGDTLDSFVKLKTGKSAFGFDTRISRDSLAAGYSANTLGEAVKLFPLTEMLCGIGLQQFRPTSEAYFAWQKPIPVSIAHAAAIQEVIGTDQNRYQFSIRKVSQGMNEIDAVEMTTKAFTATV
jgi:CRISPR-associated protein Csb3